MQLIELIDAASLIAGSDYKLAQQLGVSRHHVSNWRCGQKGCSIEYRALMASLANVDIDEVIHDALLEKHANTPLGERLLSALGNAARGVAATIVGLVSAACFVTPDRVEAAPSTSGLSYDNV